jgi:sister-chromatid-cohesion protein PDS5
MARPSRTPHGDEEVEDAQVSSNTLKFNEPLSWKAGKPIAVATLIKRLNALSKELSELEQEDVDRESLAIPARDLANIRLLQHHDDGVKAFTACCLADMLRLHAPDAPYTASQLKVGRSCLFALATHLFG